MLKEEGANIEFGDWVSDRLYQASRDTYALRPGLMHEGHESFSGFKGMDGAHFGDISELFFNMSPDGVGTKVDVVERTGNHTTIAWDLLAMVCDDAVVRGAEPVAVVSTLDTSRLQDNTCSRDIINQIAEGYVSAAALAGVVVTGGETAELGGRVNGYKSDVVFSVSGRQEAGDESQGFNYNWGATALWFARKDRALTGRKIKPGHSLVGLVERGFRSNGLTDVRTILEKEHGPDWHQKKVRELGRLSLGKFVQTPSVIYARLINELTGGYDEASEPAADISGAANITGGGQPSKLGRMLEASGYGAVIDDPINPPAIMKYVQETGDYSDEQAYRVWYMGPGMVVATTQPQEVLTAATEGNWQAKRIGEVTESPDIVIKSAGVDKPGQELVYKR